MIYLHQGLFFFLGSATKLDIFWGNLFLSLLYNNNRQTQKISVRCWFWNLIIYFPSQLIVFFHCLYKLLFCFQFSCLLMRNTFFECFAMNLWLSKIKSIQFCILSIYSCPRSGDNTLSATSRLTILKENKNKIAHNLRPSFMIITIIWNLLLLLSSSKSTRNHQISAPAHIHTRASNWLIWK